MYGGNPLTYSSSVSSAISGTEPATAFGKALKAEYIAYAQREADEWYDFFDADFFAKKAGKVVEDENILPEDPANWRFSAEEVAQKRAVRDELIALLDDGKREEKPDTAAVAQARFDCWIEESEEGWQDDLISQCWKISKQQWPSFVLLNRHRWLHRLPPRKHACSRSSSILTALRSPRFPSAFLMQLRNSGHPRWAMLQSSVTPMRRVLLPTT
jgi:hypothetical protein